MKKILAICGSTKASSTNLSLLKTIQGLVRGRLEIEIYAAIDTIPHFNPDLDTDVPPASVVAFRNRLKAADAVLISTPEYAMGVPGTLKNALDWTVSSCEFSHKPTALITASSLGEKAHASLLETLRIIEANIPDETTLLISHVKMKIGPDGTIKDAVIKAAIQRLLTELEVRI